MRNGLVGNHDIAPTLADMGNAPTPDFVDGRPVLLLAQGNVTTWPRTAILSERETNLEAPPRWQVLRMRGEKYVRFENGEKEYYDLASDPYEVHSNPETVDQAIRDDWERRLGDLHRCKGIGCRAAENSSLP